MVLVLVLVLVLVQVLLAQAQVLVLVLVYEPPPYHLSSPLNQIHVSPNDPFGI
jgi:hypothetical protein